MEDERNETANETKRNETANETKRNETANETDVLARKVDLQGVEETGKYIFDPLRARDKKRFVWISLKYRALRGSYLFYE